ncbi:hypothetical protein IC007_2503 [Sulfuracidifex tepidarius]|uniref:Uncharacterized protein n=1 Tax=Sulfuracidifex tepidarius TaxID=1294262 RepID=A0A510E747_9CREN|nr:hypothetical protein IC007_2503 [Sulfuracidifex tepidarius]
MTREEREELNRLLYAEEVSTYRVSPTSSITSSLPRTDVTQA